MNPDQELQQLKSQVAELMAWKRARTQQQLTYPLDQVSREVVQKDLLVFANYLNFFRADGSEMPNMLVKHNGVYDLISIYNHLTLFTVNPTSNVFSAKAHGFSDGQQVYFLSTDTLPDPLVPFTFYYIINATADTFQVSGTFGGAAVNITDEGTGNQYVFFAT